VSADNRLHDEMRRKMKGAASRKAKSAAPAVDKAGKWWIYGPVALACAGAVLAAPRRTRRGRRGRRAGAAAIMLVPVVSTAMSKGFDRALPQPRVGRRHRPVDHPVFPSGHGFRAAAVALTTGYVVAREGIAPAGIALPAAGVAPILVGLARLVREKHLASDTIGGWLAGTALAAALAGGYELAR
jgi:membrane-associated phospholipid phosphatase